MSNIYSDKARLYARYRWDYAPQAIQTLFTACALNRQSSVADLGAGTGIATRHFVGRVGQVYAIEPDPGMRAILARDLGSQPGCNVLDGCAESSTLPAQSVDLIVVGQAIHWFNPQPARREMARILQPGGWLAVLNNRPTGAALGKALTDIHTTQNGVDSMRHPQPGRNTPLSHYFGHNDFLHTVVAFSLHEDWETFFGSLLSASFTPTPDHPAYRHFEAAARQVFDAFCQDGRIEVTGETELWVGKPKIEEIPS